MAYFAPDALPEDLFWWHKQRILDAFNGVGGGVVWSQTADYPFDRQLTRTEMYHLRDESGLSRRDYYFETLGKMNNARENREVG